MSNIYSSEQIKNYLFCGLYYRYKHELNLPYKPINANEIYVEAMHDAFFIIANEWGLRRKHPRSFIADAAETFKEKFTSLSNNCRDSQRLIELYAQGLIVINTIIEYIDISKDIIAMFNYPFTVELGEDLHVSSKIDLMTIRNDGNRSKRSYEFTSLIDDKTYKNIQNYDHIDVGLARYFIDNIISHRIEYPYGHRYLSYFGIPRISTKVSRYMLDISLQTCTNTVDLIRKGVYLPNTSRSKCSACPFNRICDQKFMLKDLPESWINSAKRELNGN
jgi:hypothetical protein